MRCSYFPSQLSSLCLLPVFAITQTLSADPGTPKERSFRPIVPIAHSMRGSSGASRSQSVSVSLPEEAPTSMESPSLPQAPDPEDKEIANSDTMPEAKKTVSQDAAPTDDPETPGSSKTASTEPSTKKSGPTLTQLRDEAHSLAGKKLTYIFGADNPNSGGLDCSATIQYLLTRIGVKDVPRTSYDQYYWLKRKNLLDDVYASKSASSKLLKKLSPGDLIFWGGTWKSGHRVSHVMLYMGYDPSADKHYVFGARSKSSTGLTGSGVDIFELDTERGRLVAHGKIPGLIYE